MATIYAMLEQWKDAERWAIEALGEERDDPYALTVLTRVLNGNGKYEEAADAGRRAVEIDPDNTTAWFFLADAYTGTGDLEGAKKAYYHILKLDPTAYQSTRGLSSVYAAERDYEKSREYAEKAIELDRKHPGGWYQLGYAARKEGKPDEAEEALNKSLSLCDGTQNISGHKRRVNRRTLRELAWLEAESGEHGAALEYLGRMLRLRPVYANTLGDLCRFLRKSLRKAIDWSPYAGQLKDLIAFLQQEQVDPETVPWVLASLALLYCAGGDTEQAEQLAQRAVESERGKGYFQITLAIVTFRAGQRAEAIRILRRADDFTMKWSKKEAAKLHEEYTSRSSGSSSTEPETTSSFSASPTTR